MSEPSKINAMVGFGWFWMVWDTVVLDGFGWFWCTSNILNLKEKNMCVAMHSHFSHGMPKC